MCKILNILHFYNKKVILLEKTYIEFVLSKIEIILGSRLNIKEDQINLFKSSNIYAKFSDNMKNRLYKIKNSDIYTFIPEDKEYFRVRKEFIYFLRM